MPTQQGPLYYPPPAPTGRPGSQVALTPQQKFEQEQQAYQQQLADAQTQRNRSQQQYLQQQGMAVNQKSLSDLQVSDAYKGLSGATPTNPYAQAASGGPGGTGGAGGGGNPAALAASRGGLTFADAEALRQKNAQQTSQQSNATLGNQQDQSNMRLQAQLAQQADTAKYGAQGSQQQAALEAQAALEKSHQAAVAGLQTQKVGADASMQQAALGSQANLQTQKLNSDASLQQANITAQAERMREANLASAGLQKSGFEGQGNLQNSKFAADAARQAESEKAQSDILAQQAGYQTAAEQRRLEAIKGLMGSVGGGGDGGGGPATDPGIATQEDNARNAAFAHAKDQAGDIGRSALTSLQNNLGARGLGGSGLATSEAGKVINQGATQLGETSRGQAVDAAGNARARASEQFQGNLVRRGQDNSMKAALAGLIGAGGKAY